MKPRHIPLRRGVCNGWFKPEFNELYWFINKHGIVDWLICSNDEIDKEIIRQGNCFKYKEQADEFVKKNKNNICDKLVSLMIFLF